MTRTMELPADILQIVREFSKPAFPYWKVYNEAKSVVETRHLEPLRKALLGPRAARVCEELTLYFKVLDTLRKCEDSPISVWKSNEAYSNEEVWDAIDLHIVAQIKEVAQYRELLIWVYDLLG